MDGWPVYSSVGYQAFYVTCLGQRPRVYTSWRWYQQRTVRSKATHYKKFNSHVKAQAFLKARRKRILFQHAKGHSDEVFNERATKNANKGVIDEAKAGSGLCGHRRCRLQDFYVNAKWTLRELLYVGSVTATQSSVSAITKDRIAEEFMRDQASASGFVLICI